MTPASFSGRAIDLSALKPAPVAAGGGAASYVVDMDEQNFEQIIAKSRLHPVIVELNSPRARGGDALSDVLTELANAAQGKYLLARVNVDVSRQIPAAFGIQAVPTVVGVVNGQLAPLFQGTVSKEDAAAIIAQLLQAAVANGVVGRAEPVASDPSAPAPVDSRFAEADAALERGDFVAARDEFDKILAQTPQDAEALAGRAQVSLLIRLGEQDPATVLAQVQANPRDVDAHLAAADLEVGSGKPELAFARLIQVIRDTSGEVRNRVRLRLLELFETVGSSDPAVLKARRDLMSALF